MVMVAGRLSRGNSYKVPAQAGNSARLSLYLSQVVESFRGQGRLPNT